MDDTTEKITGVVVGETIVVGNIATGGKGKEGSDGKDGADGRDGIDGKDGADGKDGIDGKDGSGVPAGGAKDQILAKNSNADNDTKWINNTSGGTLYPGTGQNTDGAMTQKATTDALFNPTNGSVRIRSTGANGAQSVLIGGASASGGNAIAIGNGSTANSADGVAVGRAATASGTNAVALGDGTNSVAYSAAIGARATSARTSEVSVGDGSTNANWGTRFIGNVRDPALAQDAATKAYVDGKLAKINRAMNQFI